ncbi:riboflavin synthase [Woeseia oceani]|uniref:Riboflavin synthase n=1 Tax=Woeseia oceani TaxID=1548547 RepID=A0A193LEE0_9GAMM|nr:riboflavin synthase [Woeseia oceani]ANO50872.1 riboflavin synthase subunit alpha [Woeseia oceani]
MFTGIIKATGQIADLQPRGGDLRLRVSAPGLPWQEYTLGDSIAVNGVCLTAVTLEADGFSADVSNETLKVTTLSALRRGSRVNLEPALALGERLGGHMVSGHVDGIGKIHSRSNDARAVRFEVAVPTELGRYIAQKGSVAVDGVSLTVNAVSGELFAVTIIPHTIDETIIGDYRVGTPVNIEVDMMARYLERLLGSDGKISEDFLKAHGYG